MSVQVCFNRTEDFMIERRKLIGFLTGCLDQIAGPSKGSRVSDGEGGVKPKRQGWTMSGKRLGMDEGGGELGGVCTVLS